MAQHQVSPPRVQWQLHSGSAVVVGGLTVTPQSRVLVLSLSRGLVVWQRPAAVFVERAGRTTRLPIHDATRLAQGALIGGGVLFALVGWLLTPHRKERVA